jgi:hypothetical protein
MKGRHLAFAQLPKIHGDLLCARVITLQLGLSDAHAARAHQLVKKVAAALAVVGRLIEGDFE